MSLAPGNSTECFSPLTDVHTCNAHVLFLRILDGNIFTSYFTPSRFIHCITPNITTRFSKEDSFIRNINYCPMILGSSAEHCWVKANAGWRGLYHILFFFLPSPSFNSLSPGCWPLLGQSALHPFCLHQAVLAPPGVVLLEMKDPGPSPRLNEPRLHSADIPGRSLGTHSSWRSTAPLGAS